MAEELRRVAADTEVHARALADNLAKQGYAVEDLRADQWTLRRRRRRGDQLVTIAIARPGKSGAPGNAPPPPITGGGWAPPTGPPAG